MKYLSILFIIILFSLGSCKKSENHLKVETMGSIIIDSKKAEALIQISYTYSDEKENILKKFNEDILEKYNVTQEMYNLSLDYYINNPKEMEELINYLKHKNTEANVD